MLGLYLVFSGTFMENSSVSNTLSSIVTVNGILGTWVGTGVGAGVGAAVGDMQRTVEAVAKLGPDCLTVHTLAIKRSSRLHEQLPRYQLPPVSEVEKMIAIGAKAAEDMGMVPYYMYRQKYMAGNMENGRMKRARNSPSRSIYSQRSVRAF